MYFIIRNCRTFGPIHALFVTICVPLQECSSSYVKGVRIQSEIKVSYELFKTRAMEATETPRPPQSWCFSKDVLTAPSPSAFITHLHPATTRWEALHLYRMSVREREIEGEIEHHKENRREGWEKEESERCRKWEFKKNYNYMHKQNEPN